MREQKNVEGPDWYILDSFENENGVNIYQPVRRRRNEINVGVFYLICCIISPCKLQGGYV